MEGNPEQSKKSIVVRLDNLQYVVCPKCGSSKVWKDGLRHTKESQAVQRHVCRLCGYRFSDSATNSDIPSKPYLNKVPETSSNKIHTNTEERLYPSEVPRWNHRVCVSEREMKNLVEVETRNEKGAAGATINAQSIIFNFAWWMKKQGYSESTITGRFKIMKILVKRGADIHDPESVKETIARQPWCNKRKINAVDTYTRFLAMTGGSWEPPRYKFASKLPLIPLESEIDELVAGCSQTISTFLQLLKETAIRAGEAWSLRWADVDFATQTIRVTPEKGSNPRIFKISSKLVGLLNMVPRNSEKPFNYGSVSFLRRTFERQRKKLAIKLGNPRLQQIHFHTLRHWKASMLYHQTKDVLFVMRFLGHKSITNTLKYIQLEEALFKDIEEAFVCKVAKTIDETKALIEAGFEYICDFNDAKIFRKRK